jgi:hypothetical protein
MRVRSLSVLVALLLSGASLFLLAAQYGWFLRTTGGCSSEDRELAPTLNSLEVLSLHPRNSTLMGNGHSGCDEDDQFVYVVRSYVSSATPSQAISFYSEAARAGGWEPVQRELLDPPSRNDGDSACFHKQINSATAFFLVFASQDNSTGRGSKIDLTISATHEDMPSDGGVMC